jgi:hypothetical protein
MSNDQSKSKTFSRSTTNAEELASGSDKSIGEPSLTAADVSPEATALARDHGAGKPRTLRSRHHKGGADSLENVARMARKALIATGSNAQLVADMDAALGDTDDGAALLPPRMDEASLKALHLEATKGDPTSAARLAMARNNLTLHGIDSSDLEVTEQPAPVSTAPVKVEVMGKPVQPQPTPTA